MHRSRDVSLRVTCLALILVTVVAGTAQAASGERPHDVAVANGIIVATSLGSNDVSIFQNNTLSTQNLLAPSWGVCFAGSVAVVTTPSLDALSILTFTGGSVSVDQATCSGEEFRGCTEVIASSLNSNIVFVARVGVAPTNGDPWQHAVLKVDISTGDIVRTYITERQPRAIALSPDEQRVFVGTAQGALGGTGMTASQNAPSWDLDLFDGGTLLVYDKSSGSLEYRLTIGSPVRGLAVLDGADWGSSNDDYRVYLTHVGDGAQSESPDHGGKAIPNVISSIHFDSSHDPTARQNTIFKHEPTLDDTTVNASDLPAVVPEKLAIRPLSGSPSYAAELWITNSASGTVSRAYLELGTGAIAAQSTTVSPLGSFTVITARQSDGFTLTQASASSANATVDFHTIDPALHFRVDPVGTSTLPGLFASRPRGIAYDGATDEILVVTEFDHELLWLDETGILDRESLASASVGAAERNFFTFGRGFDFRESTADMVNNLSCGTCHVDGHIDGKVRITVRPPDNTVGGGTSPHPVAVPSIFDTGASEWLFFEGLTTVADRTGIVDGDGGTTGTDVCNYCSNNDFFLNTIGFTSTVSSPTSPWVDDSAPGSEVEIGRAWFDAMNCSRCHAEGAPDFRRTNDPAVDMGARTGPIGNTSRLLSDPTQVFITDTGQVSKAIGDPSSLRNMTNVGTRDHESGLRINGVNTPTLAGNWNNRPYMHDGRYRTLDEILQNTWVDENTGLAASIWTAATAPDNLFDDPAKAATTNSLPPTDSAEHQFKTHKHSSAVAGKKSVSEFLDQGAYDALIAFLRSLSSQRDPYPNGTFAVNSLAVTPGVMPSKAVISWTTPATVICRLKVENLDTQQVLTETTTGPGLTHSVTVTLNDFANWKASVSTTLGSKKASDDVTWSNSPQVTVTNYNASISFDCTVTVTWDTSEATTCTFDWGLASEPYPYNRETTPSGTHHSVTISILPGKLYQSKIWTPYQPIASDKTFKAKYCASNGGSAPGPGPILATAPNPFNPATEIHFALPSDGPMSLQVFDLRGRLVRTLVSAERRAGEYREVWRGRDDQGRPVASGVYFLRLKSGDVDVRKKLLLIE